MKPLIQKLPLAEQTSFVARTYTTPHFETPWHQHREVELILLLKGSGLCFIGNYIGNFTAGDVFLFGSNLPHEFRKEQEDMECSVMVVHFDPDLWGRAFWEAPETVEIKSLLRDSARAIKLPAQEDKDLGTSIKALETASGFSRTVLLLQSLLWMSRHEYKRYLSTLDPNHFAPLADDRLNRLFEYTFTHFKEPIALSHVVAMTHMSESAFCRYFKRSTKKTFVEFLNEVRIGHACRWLLHSEKTLQRIASDCGYNTMAHFNKQFQKVKGTTPSAYRKRVKM